MALPPRGTVAFSAGRQLQVQPRRNSNFPPQRAIPGFNESIVARRHVKLPNGEAAIVEVEKLRDYCLSRSHPRGRHKARVFLSRLGMTAAHAEELRAALIDAALKGTATLGTSDLYGTRYIIDFELRRDARTAEIRSCWIVLSGETSPRFVTCYIL